MSRKTAQWFVAALGATAVAAAAYYAHGLEHVATAAQMRHWAIACALQLVTAPAILSLVRTSSADETIPHSARLLGLGVLIFSGSLYLMALGFPRWLGAVTPVGGIFLMAGWTMVAFEKR